MKLSRQHLYHRLLKDLRDHKIHNTSILIACSGGIDSVMLFTLLNELSPSLKLKLNVAYVHHGYENQSHRNQSQIFVECLAQGWNIPFFTNHRPSKRLKSEESLRKYRYKCLKEWQEESQSRWLATAHTADDLLETRLIRLIRGTGVQGFSSMGFGERNILRPLIFFTKKEISTTASQQKMQWVEDPTNKKIDPLRNWIRNIWLHQLEEKHQGGVKNMSLSLERIYEESSQTSFKEFTKKPYLSLSLWKTFSISEKRVILARWMAQMRVKDYTQAHIEEVIKRIESQNRKSFQMLGRKWTLQKNLITLE